MFLDFFYSLALAGFISGFFRFLFLVYLFFKLIFLYFRNSLKGFYFVILYSSFFIGFADHSTFNIQHSTFTLVHLRFRHRPRAPHPHRRRQCLWAVHRESSALHPRQQYVHLSPGLAAATHWLCRR